MALRLGDEAPNFQAETTEGDIDFHEWIGDGWAICSPTRRTTRRSAPLNSATRQNSSRSSKSAASRRSPSALIRLEDHHGWIKDINETQNTTVNFPIIADSDRAVATAYDMIHPNAAEKFTVRSVFVIDPNKKIRLTITYPPATGRNFDEILRVVDALQLTDNHSVATPVNWKHGEDCIVVPTLSDEEATAKFPKGFTTIKPYLRTTPQPNK